MANHIDLIARFEGFSAEPFWDHHQWSIGYGSYAGSRNQSQRPNIGPISEAQGRAMMSEQLGRFERNVDSFDSIYHWTPNERAAMISFAYNIGSIDGLTAGGTRSKAEIARMMLQYNKASGQVSRGLTDRRRQEHAIFTGGAPIPDAPAETGAVGVGGDGADSGTAAGSGTDGGSTTSFASAGSVADLWAIAEANNQFWENELDQFQFYTYNLELFLVDEQSTINFLTNEYNLNDIMSDAWPNQGIKRVSIAMTGASTEFNLQDLVVESLGYGGASGARMSGTAKSLTFTLTQVGNTSLADSLQNAAVLCGFSSIHDATWYMKIKFIGYDKLSKASTLDATKVIPFKISQFRDLQTTTDQRGTSTVLNGTVIQQKSFDVDINQIEYPFEFKIGDTLQDTLTNFIESLNEIISVPPQNFTGDLKFINTYKVLPNPDFERFLSSKMNGENPNLSSANNSVGTRTANGLNISEQIGQVTAGSNIYDIITDICNQALDVRTELTNQSDTFSDTIFVVPEAVPKLGGLNVLSNTRGHNVTYHLGIRRTVLVQNQADLHLKTQNTSKMVNEIFEKGRCRKIYHYQYTGLNDQILEFTVSLNKQLQKAFVTPNDEFMFNNFVQLVGGQPVSLNEVAQQAFDTATAETTRLNTDRDAAAGTLEGVRDQLDTQAQGIASEFINEARNAGIDLPEGVAEFLSSDDFSFSSLGSLVGALEGEAGERLQQLIDPKRVNLEQLSAAVQSAQETIGGLDAELQKNQALVDKILQDSIGASLSDQLSESLGTTASNFESLGLDSSNSGFVLIESLDTDFVTQLTESEFRGLIETMMQNPTVFKRVVISRLRDLDRTNTFRSSSQEDIETARQKYYEGLNADISMQNLSIVIKGDPFWLDNYITPEKAHTLFGNNSTSEEFKNYTLDLSGQNYCMIVTNKAAGTDENDNIKIANLMVAVYLVKSITNNFSNGLFTQTLNMIKMPFPADFKPLNALEGSGAGTGESLSGQGDVQGDGSGNSTLGATAAGPLGDGLRGGGSNPIATGIGPITTSNGNGEGTDEGDPDAEDPRGRSQFPSGGNGGTGQPLNNVNGVISNPISALTDFTGPAGFDNMNDILSGTNPLNNPPIVISQPDSGIDVSIPSNLLTPDEQATLNPILGEISNLLDAPIVDTEVADRAAVLSDTINDVVNEATSGVQGIVRNDVAETEATVVRSAMANRLQDLTEEVDSIYFDQSVKEADLALRNQLALELALENLKAPNIEIFDIAEPELPEDSPLVLMKPKEFSDEMPAFAPTPTLGDQPGVDFVFGNNGIRRDLVTNPKHIVILGDISNVVPAETPTELSFQDTNTSSNPPEVSTPDNNETFNRLPPSAITELSMESVNVNVPGPVIVDPVKIREAEEVEYIFNQIANYDAEITIDIVDENGVVKFNDVRVPYYNNMGSIEVVDPRTDAMIIIDPVTEFNLSTTLEDGGAYTLEEFKDEITYINDDQLGDQSALMENIANLKSLDGSPMFPNISVSNVYSDNGSNPKFGIVVVENEEIPRIRMYDGPADVNLPTLDQCFGRLVYNKTTGRYECW